MKDMTSNYLEQLMAEWYEYRGYFIRRNVLVGKREKGGYECELDVVAFHPKRKHLVHLECSSDASSWSEREGRFTKKFHAGRKYIPTLFPGLLPPSTPLEQMAVLVYAGKGRRHTLAGGHIVLLPDILAEIMAFFSRVPSTKAVVPEQYALLRTLQFVSDYREDLFNTQANCS